MKFEELVKNPLFWLVTIGVGYSVIKDHSQPANNANHDNSDNLLPTTPEYNPMTWAVPVPQVPQVSQPSRIRFTEEDKLRIMKETVEEVFSKRFGGSTLADSASTQLKLSPDPQTIEAGKWLRLIHHPSIVLILGKRGGGKSALGYRLLEYLRYTASPYVVGLPKEARALLPDYIGMAASLEDVPPKAIALVDEAYMPYHARSSMAAEAKAMSQLVNLSRQREQTLIFVSQESRQIDRNIASSANVIIFKDLGILQLKFDRRELNDIATQAKQAFTTVTGDKRKQAYVFAPDSDFMGLVENSVPTFWCEKLSHIFATGGEITARVPKKTPLSGRIEKAKQLKQQGLSNGKIAKLMGVTKPTIKNYLEGYPYKA